MKYNKKDEVKMRGVLFFLLVFLSRTTDKSSSSESVLAQIQFMKIWVESSRFELMKRFELKNLTQAQLFTIRASKLVHEPMYIYWVGLIFRLSTFTNIRLVYLQDWYINWYKINISTNYIFNDIFAALIWTDRPAKKSSQICKSSH
jgi:hypothetical protein